MSNFEHVNRPSKPLRREPYYGSCLHVISGPMFSSKTTELLRLLRKAEEDNHRPLCVKPAIDTRRSLGDVTTHDGKQRRAEVVASSKEILLLVEAKGTSFIGIDEAQFFDKDLPEVCGVLLSQGKAVYVAGLNMDYQGRPFGPMPTLMAMADTLDPRVADCSCGAVATHSYRIPSSDSGRAVQVGAEAAYEARCRSCWAR